MKKIALLAVVPFLFSFSGKMFADESSFDSGIDMEEIMEEVGSVQKEQAMPSSQSKPDFNQNGGNHGGNNGGNHPGQPGQPTQPGHPTQPGQPGQPNPQPVPVDTTQARRDGIRDGSEKGKREGRREGYSEGIDAGERDGRRRGTDEGDTAGRQSGYNDGYSVDQSAGTQRGNADGQNAGINNGTEAGKKRCYDAGYTAGYNATYPVAEQAGLQDAASYNAGYAEGQADAAVVEAQNGEKAGYQVGFSQREAELEKSFPEMIDMKGLFAKSGLRMGAKVDLPIKLVRHGYTTPEEKRAYEEGFREGYQRSYRRAYDEAKREGYNERYHIAYRRAYDAQFSISYRNGFNQGKEQGYQNAYNSAYNSAYNVFYDQYSNKEYADQRALGMSAGQASGTREGFAAGCAEQSALGYKAGYEKTAAQVYPGAFEAGKQSGILAANKYYSENAVLKVLDIAFYDENNDGKFEASESVMLKANIRNLGFQKSDTVAIAVKSELGEITLVPDLSAVGVGGRAETTVTLNIGKLYDVVAPNSDALYAKFSEKGRTVGDLRQQYLRTNTNKVGVVGKDGADVTKKDTWFFPGKITTLNSGEKVIITEVKGGYYRVRKSEVSGGNWTEGFIKSDKLSLQ